MKKKEAKILGYTYKIEYPCNERAMGRSGRVLLDKQIIQLPNDQILEGAISSILHEYIEILDYHLEFNLSHHIISGLEAGLFQALIQNGVDLSPLLEEEEEVVRTSYEFEEKSKQEQEEKRKRKAIEYPGGEKS